MSKIRRTMTRVIDEDISFDFFASTARIESAEEEDYYRTMSRISWAVRFKYRQIATILFEKAIRNDWHSNSADAYQHYQCFKDSSLEEPLLARMSLDVGTLKLLQKVHLPSLFAHLLDSVDPKSVSPMLESEVVGESLKVIIGLAESISLKFGSPIEFSSREHDSSSSLGKVVWIMGRISSQNLIFCALEKAKTHQYQMADMLRKKGCRLTLSSISPEKLRYQVLDYYLSRYQLKPERLERLLSDMVEHSRSHLLILVLKEHKRCGGTPTPELLKMAKSGKVRRILSKWV